MALRDCQHRCRVSFGARKGYVCKDKLETCQKLQMFVVPGLAVNDFGIQVRNICQEVGFSLKETKK